MKNSCFLVILTVLIGGCVRSTPERKMYFEDFNWTITIPEKFESVEAEQWEKMQNKGLDMVEKTYGEEIDIQTEVVFIFKSDLFNYFEANRQPFDSETDGDYLETCHMVNEILYGTFISQMPGVKIDTMTAVESVDRLEFQTMEMKVTYPNGMVLTLNTFSRLFGKEEFAVNIMYVDDEKGKQMMDAWKNSKFSN